MIRKPVKVVLVAGRSGLVCNACGHWKPLGFMARDRSKPSGRRSRCRLCERKRTRVNLEYTGRIVGSIVIGGLRGEYPYRCESTCRLIGLTPVAAQDLARAQGGRCALSGVALEGRDDVVLDHDHDTGLARGFILARYNVGLGLFADDPALLRLAAAYVEQQRLRHLEAAA